MPGQPRGPWSSFPRVHTVGTALGPDEQRLRLSGGIAELLQGDTPASLSSGRRALYRAKELGRIERHRPRRRATGGSGTARELERRERAALARTRRRYSARVVERAGRRTTTLVPAEESGEENGSLVSTTRGPEGGTGATTHGLRLPDVRTLEPRTRIAARPRCDARTTPRDPVNAIRSGSFASTPARALDCEARVRVRRERSDRTVVSGFSVEDGESTAQTERHRRDPGEHVQRCARD